MIEHDGHGALHELRFNRREFGAVAYMQLHMPAEGFDLRRQRGQRVKAAVAFDMRRELRALSCPSVAIRSYVSELSLPKVLAFTCTVRAIPTVLHIARYCSSVARAGV